jgi:hypothetical protein
LAKKILEERVGENFCSIFDFSTIYREKRAIKVGKRADFGPGSTIFSDEHRLSFDREESRTQEVDDFACADDVV